MNRIDLLQEYRENKEIVISILDELLNLQKEEHLVFAGKLDTAFSKMDKAVEELAQ